MIKGSKRIMKSKEVANTTFFAVALAMAAASFSLMILTNITGENYISTVITLLAIGLFVVAVAGIRSVSKN
jgi:predicted permease